MKKILTLNPIAKVGLDILGPDYIVSDTFDDPDAILVRSSGMHEMQIPKSLLAVARAGAGVNNIPLDALAKEGVVVFNTPGANANGVKELTLAALLLASRDIVGGAVWTESQKDNTDVVKTVEKCKAKFAGREIFGKTLGVIGLGAIGGAVANAAQKLGMKVIGFDPLLTVKGAWGLSESVVCAESYEDIYRNADYITLHVPANADTRGMICGHTLSLMKDGVRILNLSRADLVVAKDIREALASGKVAAYVTDFPTPETLGVPGILNIPHLGASTEESEDNCAVMAAEELKEFLETGNIKNSVNYPKVSLPYLGATRICLCHKNLAGMLSGITAVLGAAGINIENLSNGSRGEYAYTILEMLGNVPTEVTDALRALDGMIRVRVIGQGE